MNNLGRLTLLLGVLFLFKFYGFVNTAIIVVILAILFKIIPISWRIITVIWEFIEYIIFAPYRYIFGAKLNQYGYNPLIAIVEFDLKKLFRLFK